MIDLQSETVRLKQALHLLKRKMMEELLQKLVPQSGFTLDKRIEHVHMASMALNQIDAIIDRLDTESS